jgi:outer membrane protein assembly factor BamB
MGRCLGIVLLCAVALAAVALPAGVAEANWPNWRGPTRDGVASEAVPVTWDAQTNIAWRLEMPEWTGSTPVIWGERIFLSVAAGDDIEFWCLNRDTGQVLWKRFLSGGNHQQQKQNMSSPSPVTDGQLVWVMTGTGLLRAFDFEGREVWMRDIQADYGRFGLNWGYASSPLLHEDALYVQVLHGMKTDDPSYLLQLDAGTGDTIWRHERPTNARRESPDSYTTPALLRYDGITEIVVTGGDAVTGHDPTTGQELWRADGLNPTRNGAYRLVASPVVVGNLIVAPTRVRPLLVLRAGGRGDVLDTHVAWAAENGPDVPTPVSDGEYLYIVNDQGIVYVHDLETGAIVYGRERLRPGTYSASPVISDGKIYVTNEAGLTSVFRTGPEFEVLAENPLDDYTLSSPAVSDGQIFIRTSQFLYAIGSRRSASGS